jgi:hypothetical protein
MKKNSKAKKGYLLDIGLTEIPQQNYLRMGPAKGSDIVHDTEKFPWPLESDSCLIVLAAHIVEHIKPWLIMSWMNELWRVTINGGQVAISTPYAGSPSWHQDPTHCTSFNEISFGYFDPQFKALYAVYKPKPWKMEKGSPIWKSEGSIECLLRPIK